MATFLDRRWRRQPQCQVRIDWSNELSSGLIFALNGATRQVVYSRAITYGAQYTDAPRSYGKNLCGHRVSATAGDEVELFRVRAGGGEGFVEMRAGEDISSMFVIDRIGVGAGNPGIWRNDGGVGTTFFIRNGGAAQYWMRVNGTDFTGVGNFPTSGDHTVGQSLRSGARLDLYTDGVATYTTTTSVPATEDSTGLGGVSVIGIQGSLGSTEKTYGSYALSVFWNEWKSPGAWAEFYRNKWQIFARDPRRVYFVASTAAAANQDYIDPLMFGAGL